MREGEITLSGANGRSGFQFARHSVRAGGAAEFPIGSADMESCLTSTETFGGQRLMSDAVRPGIQSRFPTSATAGFAIRISG